MMMIMMMMMMIMMMMMMMLTLLTYLATTYLDEIGTGRAWIADVKVESLYFQGVTWT